MEISKVIIEELLLTSSDLEIPFYQREYIWTQRETKKLLQDIFYNKAKEYYVGSIIFKNNGSKKLIIDGQQRMSTFWLILKTLEQNDKHISSDNMSNIKKNIEYFKFKTNNLQDGKILEKILNNNPILEKEENSNYWKNYIVIKKFFETYIGKLDEFYEKFKKLIATKIIVDENIDEHILFAQINSTGKKLSAADLIKNNLFSKIKIALENCGLENQLDQKLKLYFDLISYENDNDNKFKDELFRHFISYKTKNLCNNDQEKIYDSYNKTLENIYNNDVLKLFNDLCIFATSYKFIKNNDNYSKYKFKDSLNFISQSFKTYAVLITDIILKNSTLENFRLTFNKEQEENIYNSLLILENYKIRREFFELKEKTITRYIPNLVSSINNFWNNINIKEIKLKYQDILYYLLFTRPNNQSLYKALPSYRAPTNLEFENAFKEKNLYNATKFCKLFLIRLSTFKNKTEINFNNFTIEHVLPINLKKWKNAGYDEDENEIIKVRDTIGNLTLTPHNSEYSNEIFEEKIKRMKEKESFVFNNYFFDLKEWNITTIKNRTNHLYKITNEIWNFQSYIDLIEKNIGLLDKLEINEIVHDDLDIFKLKSHFKKIENVSEEEIKTILYNYLVKGSSYTEIEFNVFKMNFKGWVCMGILNSLKINKEHDKRFLSETDFQNFYISKEKETKELLNSIDSLIKY